MADDTETVTVKVRADTSEFDAGIRQIGYALKNIGASIQQLGFAWSAAITAPIVGTAAAALNAAGSLEQTRIAFTGMLGSADAADKMLTDMKKFAAESPFEFSDLTVATRRMLAYGFAAEDVLPILKDITDGMAAMGASSEMINRVTLAFGQIHAKGALSAEEMRQLAETGLPVWEYLSKATGKSVQELYGATKNKEISGDVAIEAIRKGIQEDFGGMTEKQLDTFQGQMGKLHDLINFALMDIGDALMPFAKTVLEKIVFPVVEGIDKLALAFKGLNPVVQGVIIVAAGLAAALGPFFLALGYGISMIGGMMAGFGQIGLVLDAVLANWGMTSAGLLTTLQALAAPILTIVGLIAYLVASFIYCYETSATLRQEVADLISSIAYVGSVIANTIGKSLPQSFDAIGKALAWLLGLFEPVWVAIVDGLGMVVARIGIEFPKIWAPIAETAGKVGEALMPIFDWLGEKLPAIIPPIVAGVKIFFDAFQQALTVIAPIVSYVGDIVAKLVSALVPVIVQIADTVWDFCAKLIEYAWPIISQVIDWLMAKFNELAPMIAWALDSIITPIVDTITSISPYVVALIREIGNAFTALLPYIAPVVSVIVTLLEWIVDGILGIVTFAIPLLVGIFKAVWPLIDVALKVTAALVIALLEVFSWAANGIADALSWLWNNIIGPIFGWICEKIGSVIGFFQLLWEKVKEVVGWIGDKFHTLDNALGNPFQKFIDGIVNGFNGLKNTISGIVDEIKRLLGIATSDVDAAEAARRRSEAAQTVEANPYEGLTWQQQNYNEEYGGDISGGHEPTPGELSQMGYSSHIRALGGPVAAGVPYMVGERGKELFVPGVSGNIIPNSLLSAAAQSITVIIEMDGDAIARKTAPVTANLIRMRQAIR